MCGIFALFDPNLPAAELEALCKQLTALLHHRGPDEVGCHVGARFALGHARLSIMDPAGGQQPLLHRATGNVLVHNGEIYNHAELRARAVAEAAAAGAPPPAYATSSDSEAVLPLFATHGADVAAMLDGMFAVVVARPDGTLFAARDPCGIKPLYRGWSADGRLMFASELKCLVGQVEDIEEFPAGHYWTSAEGYRRYFAPDWLRPTFEPSAAGAPTALPTGGAGRVRELLKAAVAKRLMSDVGYGLLLSGGLDSAIVCALMAELTDMTEIQTFTVGMADSPDVTAAREVARHFGTRHREYLFTADEAFALLPQVVYHLETYEPELIRSSIPNYLLARLAGAHTKVVITGEGADELFAGYLYFRDCPNRAAMHTETLRIWGHLHSVNLQRSDRMGMAHGLEARVPFLDVALLAEAYGAIDPSLKMHGAGRAEKALLRELFEGLIPHDVLWRTKAMQCEGVGTDWVNTLQARCAAEVSDAELAAAPVDYPRNPPQSKEEVYYRRLFEVHFKGMDRFVHVWPGGCRAGGAAWQSAAYTRAGLADTSQLRHALMARAEAASDVMRLAAEPPTAPSLDALLALLAAPGDSRGAALELLLAAGGDSRIALSAGTNKYGVPPRCEPAALVRSSCTSSPPTARGYAAALEMLGTMADKRAGTLAAFAAEMEGVRRRLRAAWALEADGEVVLAPSGVEAEYLAAALAQYLAAPGAPLCSFVAAAGEVGTSTAAAAAARSYDVLAPFGRDPPPGERLAGFENITQVECKARDAAGRPVDAAAALGAALGADTAPPGAPWTVRLVAGTKTGFTTAAPPPAAALAGALVVVDACQTRITPSQIRSHLAAGHLVLVTGSKFLHGASFSAAALLPASLAARVRARAADADAPAVPAGLGGHFSRHEFAETLPAWRAALHATPNLGLLLRWHTALPHLEFAAGLADDRRRALEDGWAAAVAALVAAAPALSVFASEAGIVSVACARPAGDSSEGGAVALPLSYEALGRVHAWCAMDLAHVPGARPCAHAGTVVYVGQPVKITQGLAVLRIASNAELLERLHEGTYAGADDAAVVDKLAWLVESFTDIEAVMSGAPKVRHMGSDKP